MRDIKVLDVTLRDGGIVNDFNFGEQNMKKIVAALEDSGIRYIELGYLEKNRGTARGRSQYCSEKVIEEYLLSTKKPGVTYLTMMDYGKFDVDRLGDRSEKGIDAVRLAFHKRNYDEPLPLYKELSRRGYDVYMQPMVTMHYSDDELKRLVDDANELDIKGLYFVDTFGQMQKPDIERMASLFDSRLRPDIALGFHSHNNIQMAYANTITFLEMQVGRDIMIDSSIMGMGRGAGNLNTELLLSHLNQYYSGQYNISPLLGVIDTVIEAIRQQHPWGYSAAYYLSSVNDCSPIYAGHYYNKHMLSIEHLSELLGMLEGEKRISFDKAYAEDLYRRYKGKEPFDDSETINKLHAIFQNKTVCLIAPGKSLVGDQEKVKKAVEDADISVSLNCDRFDSDYELITRSQVYKEAAASTKDLIVLSSVTRTPGEHISIIDYYRWITVDEDTHDSAGFIALKLLTGLGAKEIKLAGFDGFNIDLNINYCDESLKKPVSPEQIASLNQALSAYIAEKQNTYDVTFVTRSIYEQNKKKTTPKIMNLVFDCDGVLINSIKVQESAYYGSYAEVVGDDKCPPFSEYIKYTGDSLPNIFTKMGLPLEMVGPYRRISSQAVDKIILNREAIDLVRELKQYGVRSSICTGKDRKRMIEILKYFGVDELFDAIVCSDDVSDPKPSPVPVIKAIREMGHGAEPSNTMVIGDGYYDILSARRAGCSVILTLWYGDEGVPREADHTVSTVDELRDILLSKICG